MARTIEAGTWRGKRIRTARKEGCCEYGRCPEIIRAGDDYFDGELNPYKAGGFRCDRYCMSHASDGIEPQEG